MQIRQNHCASLRACLGCLQTIQRKCAYTHQDPVKGKKHVNFLVMVSQWHPLHINDETANGYRLFPLRTRYSVLS